MSSVEVNGTTLHYDQAGAGPALLFVHGMAGFAGVWSDQMARLSDTFHTVAYDRRGHSRSPQGEVTQETVELHADDAAALIRALDLAPVMLVGSSGGARVCIDLLRRYPELLDRAVLSEPPVFSLAPQIGAEFMARVKPAVGDALQSGRPESALDAFFSIIDPEFWASAPEDRKQAYRANLRAMLADLQMPAYQLTASDLEGIATPCLVLYGSASLPWFNEIARIIGASIPGARLAEIAGAGHATYAARPEEFARAVREFAATGTQRA